MECPFLEAGVPACGEVLNMENLTVVFDLCMNRYVSCPVYQRLSQTFDPGAEVALHGRGERGEICQIG